MSPKIRTSQFIYQITCFKNTTWVGKRDIPNTLLRFKAYYLHRRMCPNSKVHMVAGRWDHVSPKIRTSPFGYLIRLKSTIWMSNRAIPEHTLLLRFLLFMHQLFVFTSSSLYPSPIPPTERAGWYAGLWPFECPAVRTNTGIVISRVKIAGTTMFYLPNCYCWVGKKSWA